MVQIKKKSTNIYVKVCTHTNIANFVRFWNPGWVRKLANLIKFTWKDLIIKPTLASDTFNQRNFWVPLIGRSISWTSTTRDQDSLCINFWRLIELCKQLKFVIKVVQMEEVQLGHRRFRKWSANSYTIQCFLETYPEIDDVNFSVHHEPLNSN